MEKNVERFHLYICTYIYIWFTFLVQQKLTQHCKSTMLQLKKKKSIVYMCFPGGASGKEPTCQCKTQSLGREDPLEKGMGTHSSILAWRIPRTEGPGGLQSVGGKQRNTTKRLISSPFFLTWTWCFQGSSTLQAESVLRPFLRAIDPIPFCGQTMFGLSIHLLIEISFFSTF